MPSRQLRFDSMYGSPYIDWLPHHLKVLNITSNYPGPQLGNSSMTAASCELVTQGTKPNVQELLQNVTRIKPQKGRVVSIPACGHAVKAIFSRGDLSSFLDPFDVVYWRNHIKSLLESAFTNPLLRHDLSTSGLPANLAFGCLTNYLFRYDDRSKAA